MEIHFFFWGDYINQFLLFICILVFSGINNFTLVNKSDMTCPMGLGYSVGSIALIVVWSYTYSVYLLIFKNFYLVCNTKITSYCCIIQYRLFSDRMSDELIPHVDKDGSAFFDCELLAEAVSSASELEQSGLSLCCVSSLESLKEQSTASNSSSNELVNESSNCVQSDSRLVDVSVSCSYHVVAGGR